MDSTGGRTAVNTGVTASAADRHRADPREKPDADQMPRRLESEGEQDLEHEGPMALKGAKPSVPITVATLAETPRRLLGTFWTGRSTWLGPAASVGVIIAGFRWPAWDGPGKGA